MDEQTDVSHRHLFLDDEGSLSARLENRHAKSGSIGSLNKYLHVSSNSNPSIVSGPMNACDLPSHPSKEDSLKIQLSSNSWHSSPPPSNCNRTEQCNLPSQHIAIKDHYTWRVRLSKTVEDGEFTASEVRHRRRVGPCHSWNHSTRTREKLHRAAPPSSGEAGEPRRWPADAKCAKRQQPRKRNTGRGLRSVQAIDERKDKRKFLRSVARRIARHNIIHTLTYYPKGQDTYVSNKRDKSDRKGRSSFASQQESDKRTKIRHAAKQAHAWYKECKTHKQPNSIVQSPTITSMSPPKADVEARANITSEKKVQNDEMLNVDCCGGTIIQGRRFL